MCGIIAALLFSPDQARAVRSQIPVLSRRIRHRGPDWRGIEACERCILAHERLAIVSPQSGHQPLVDKSTGTVLSANGEIYNHLQLRHALGGEALRMKEQSDCEVILHLFAERVRPLVIAAQAVGLSEAARTSARAAAVEAACSMVASLDGMFAFVLHDPATSCTVVARDHMGIAPLYAGLDADGVVWFASELKGLPAAAAESATDASGRVATSDFAPGHAFVHFPDLAPPSGVGAGGCDAAASSLIPFRIPGDVVRCMQDAGPAASSPPSASPATTEEESKDGPARLTPVAGAAPWPLHLTPWYRPRWHGDDERGWEPTTAVALPHAPLPAAPYAASAFSDKALAAYPLDVLQRVRFAFERAVVKRLMSDVPWGVLLSGGLDSSLVASVAARHAQRRVEAEEKEQAWWPRMHSFSIGLRDSPDLPFAEEVARLLGTAHHSFVYSVQEGLDAVSEVVRATETYDVTTIRASTPMYLMSRKIKAMGVKMVLSGEGSDEAMAGYLYFHKAPSADELHKETVRKLKALFKYDCLRANKSTMAWGVEARVPFLDREFLDVVMTLDPVHKMCGTHPSGPRMEKHLLRCAFDDPERPYLPASVLWRQKEQFSDSVGYSWIDTLRAMAEQVVGDEAMRGASSRFPVNPPTTKEAYLYRSLFAAHFPSSHEAALVPGGPSIACSTATAIAWDREFAARADPSGRAVSVHAYAYA